MIRSQVPLLEVRIDLVDVRLGSIITKDLAQFGRSWWAFRGRR
jgi:hypothetical protein